MQLRLTRNIRAENDLDAFWLSAISSLLLLRFYLSLTNYPQVGGTNYHISHMLWGGVLMLIALALTLAFLGNRVRLASALIGGAGFGIFIDELGKFITRDANYFYRPTIGLLYLIFVILYLTFNFLGRTRDLTPEEYEQNALAAMQDLLQNPQSHHEAEIRQLLGHAPPHSPVTKALLQLLDDLPSPELSKPSWPSRLTNMARRQYNRFWRHRGARRVIGALFLLSTIVFPLGILLNLLHTVINTRSFILESSDFPHGLVLGQLISSSFAAALAIVGAIILTTSRVKAYEWFRRAILINLYVTQFFIFARLQFGAIPGLLLNLALLIGLQLAQQEERRLAAARATKDLIDKAR